jgi:sugar (pentulose or hexulose) kinase
MVDTPVASARGAALLGGIVSGIWADAADTASVTPRTRVVATPNIRHASAYDEVYAQYLRLSGATSATA